MIKLLEFRHIAPFEGCHWRYEYFILQMNAGAIVTGIHPVVFTPGKAPPSVIVYNGYLKEPTLSGRQPYYLDFFTDYRLRDWDADTIHEVIPAAYWPAFARFCKSGRRRRWVRFRWPCGECGRLFQTVPENPAEIVHPGGMQLEAGAWHCGRCHGRIENE